MSKMLLRTTFTSKFTSSCVSERNVRPWLPEGDTFDLRSTGCDQGTVVQLGPKFVKVLIRGPAGSSVGVVGLELGKFRPINSP